MWLEGRSPRTIEAYVEDLRDFSRFLLRVGYVKKRDILDRHGAIVTDVAVTFLLSRSHAEANEVVLTYRNAMKDGGHGSEKKAPATVNRRIGALRSLVKLANMLGHVPWLLGVQNVKHEKYRDTRGPGPDKIAKLLEALKGAPNEARNRAMVSLMFDMGLRRGEVSSLLLEHLHIENGVGRLSILGKGRAEREWCSMPPVSLSTVQAFLDERGDAPGPLFGITGHGIWEVLRTASRRAGIGVVRPHGLRHSGITRALDKGFDVRKVQKFSRHKNINTLQIYDDNREDVFGEVAAGASTK